MKRLFNVFKKYARQKTTEVTAEFDFLSWEHRKAVQPPTLRYPEAYTGQADLRLACTQLSITAAEQRKLIRDWAACIRNSPSLRRIFFYSKVPQQLLEAAASVPEVEDVFIKWSGNGITDYSPLRKLRKLRRLYIGSGTNLADFQVLGGLQQLEWLEVHEQSGLQSFEGIEKLRALKGLIITGGLHGKIKVADLQPLSKLDTLRYLSLASTQAVSGSLAPLSRLQQLSYLDLPIYYTMEEFARLFVCLPHCNHGIAAYRNTGVACDNCRKGEIVYPMSKGKRPLCTHCDQGKLDRLTEQFQQLVAEKSKEYLMSRR